MRTYGKYQHTEQDFKEDMTTMVEFFEAYRKLHPNYEVYQAPERINYLKHGAQAILLMPEVTLDTVNFFMRKSPMVFLTSDINPNGITEGVFGRTFTIQTEVSTSFKLKYARRWDEGLNLINIYEYSVNFRDLLELDVEGKIQQLLNKIPKDKNLSYQDLQRLKS